MKGRDAVIGCNFYLRRKKPTIHETVHICKRSFGWRTTWQESVNGHDEYAWPKWCDEDPSAHYPELPNEIHSVEDIRNYLRTGEWELVDEYGTVLDEWEGEIDSLESWDGGKQAYNAAHPDNPVTWEACEHDKECGEGYRDSKGNIFTRTGFC